jgi:hypothetical protein
LGLDERGGVVIEMNKDDYWTVQAIQIPIVDVIRLQIQVQMCPKGTAACIAIMMYYGTPRNVMIAAATTVM